MSEVMLVKVRKLLAKAEDPACTPEESATFTAKATELIARYGVDRALLAARDPATDPVGDRVVEVVAPYARDKAGLLAAVAAPLRCRCVRRRHGSGFAMHLFGFASDLERVDLLFTSLLVQAAHGLAGAVVPVGSTRPRSGAPGSPASPRWSAHGWSRRRPGRSPTPAGPRSRSCWPTAQTGSSAGWPRPTPGCAPPLRAGSPAPVSARVPRPAAALIWAASACPPPEPGNFPTDPVVACRVRVG